MENLVCYIDETKILVFLLGKELEERWKRNIIKLIGMLHHLADPRDIKKAYAYAVAAKAEGVNFLLYSRDGK
ncbi:hypothetical protein ACFVHQ_04780 [Actinomycetes bacterium NPDC127524]